MQVTQRTQAAPYWGVQQVASWETGQTASRLIANCELVNALRALPSPPNDQLRPVGVWRISAIQTFGAEQLIGLLEYGSGNASITLQNVLLPCVAYVPGFAKLSVAPAAAPTGLLSASGTVVPMFEAAAQRLRTLEDASGGAVVLPGSVVRLTALEASTYTPFGAAAPIAVVAGATVEIAGRTTLNTGRVAAWHEL